MLLKKRPEQSASPGFRFGLIFQSNPALMSINKAADGTFLEVNDTFLRRLGRPAKDLIGKTFAEIGLFTGPGEYETVREEVGRLGEVRNREISLRLRSGETLFGCLSLERIEMEGLPCFITAIVDITEHKRVASALSRTEQQFERIAGSIHDILYSVDAGTKEFSYLSPSFERLLGYTMDDIKATGGREAFLSQVIQKGAFSLQNSLFNLLISKAAREKEVWESWWKAKDGSLLYLEDCWTPVYESGRLVGTDGILRDITERRKAEDALREAMEKVKKANEAAEQARATAESASLAKGMFLARMSHEIRTPMNSVIGFSDMLLDTVLNEEQVEYVRNITKSGEALLALINEILDFSKIEAGRLAFQNIDFDLELAAFDVCHMIQPRLGDRPVEILCRVGENLPGFIKSDPSRIRQVLLNFMSNAVKFTDNGEIELFVDIEEEAGGRLKLHAKVRDTGIGIAGDKLEAIFEAFQQADGSITRRYGGTGLGLAICRLIARHMGGEVWAESEPGRGSTFHFTAWVEKSDRIIPAVRKVEALEGKRALLVDDNETNLVVLAHSLGQMGLRTVSLKSGAQVLPEIQKALEEHDPFDVCVLDIQMPDVSGYDVARQLRAQEDSRISALKLLAFSSSVSRRIKAFSEIGFDGFLPKPIQRRRMQAMIKRLLGDAAEREEGGNRPDRAKILTQHVLAEEAKHSVRILLVEDNPMNMKLAQSMLAKAGYRLDTAADGREAVDKFTADPEGYDLIFMDVHMPELDGLEATRLIRNHGFEDIPIIALTADAMQEDRDVCLDAGMNDYLSKPIRREDVFGMIKKWVFKES
ncbi:MAG: response regulator [Candidatus Aminicenantes bacterium]|nr:response regulator [Candidatus Aminicenantes bacterium]